MAWARTTLHEFVVVVDGEASSFVDGRPLMGSDVGTSVAIEMSSEYSHVSAPH